ncbi:uncharacterized protein [Littorina saxatilis]|uniref:Uncharacterized protein n=1 Tax=Littorina saxatilis TaxID=31220 RepID=A0AAN9GLU8_9CAEN
MSSRREIATSPDPPRPLALPENCEVPDSHTSDSEEPGARRSDREVTRRSDREVTGQSDGEDFGHSDMEVTRRSDGKVSGRSDGEEFGKSDACETNDDSRGQQLISSHPYTPPSSTPVKPYRFSDHVHKDRHIFLKGASLGIGCGSDTTTTTNNNNNSVGGFTDVCELAPLPFWEGRTAWSCGGGWRGKGCFVDEEGNVFYQGQCVQLGMALGKERLPALHRVQLALSSADCKYGRPQEEVRYPHLHQQHQKPGGNNRQRRPFNEQLNTYVDTMKRIRAVQCLEDLYRSTPSPVFPYLATPPTPTRRKPPPKPAAARMYVSRAQNPQPPAPSLARNATSFNMKVSPPEPHPSLHPPSLARNATSFNMKVSPPEPHPSLHPPSLARNATSFNIKRPPLSLTPALPLSTIAAVDHSRDGVLGGTSTTPSSLPRNASKTSSHVSEGRKSRDPESELATARTALQNTQQASGSRDYMDYFLAKEGRQGTFGRLFESYPKRVLTVRPGKLVRQRTDILARSRMRLLQ